MFARVVFKPVLATERIFDDCFLTGRSEPIRTLPAILRAETCANLAEAIVQRRFADAACRFKFTIRPRHLIMLAENFSNTFAKERAIVRPSTKTANVHAPEIEGLFACKHPLS